MKRIDGKTNFMTLHLLYLQKCKCMQVFFILTNTKTCSIFNPYAAVGTLVYQWAFWEIFKKCDFLWSILFKLVPFSTTQGVCLIENNEEEGDLSSAVWMFKYFYH